MAYSAKRFLVQSKIMNAIVVNIKVLDIEVLYVIDVELKLQGKKYVENEWGILHLLFL